MGAGHAGDEIEGPERLRLDFSKALHLLTFNVTDFFNEKEPSTDDCMPGDPACYLERGSFMLLFGDGTSSGWNFFQALATSLRSTNGVQDIAVNMDNVVGMIFSAPGITTEGGMTKYEELSVAGIKFNDSATPVPEPATMFLVGAGIAGILAKRRRA
jgi:hypothetical protein